MESVNRLDADTVSKGWKVPLHVTVPQASLEYISSEVTGLSYL